MQVQSGETGTCARGRDPVRPKRCPDCEAEQPPVFCQYYPLTCKERLLVWEEGYHEGYADGYVAAFEEDFEP